MQSNGGFFILEQTLGCVDIKKEALQFKKQQGIKLGRPKGTEKSKLDAFRSEIEALLANGSTQKFVAKRYNTTEVNLHNWLKEKND